MKNFISLGLNAIPSLEFTEKLHARLLRRWLKCDKAEKRDMSLPGFLAQLKVKAHLNEEIKNPERYVLQSSQALALLRRELLLWQTPVLDYASSLAKRM